MNDMTNPPVDFRGAMRGLASGVSLVTTRGVDGAPHGMAATAVNSLSAAPPQLLICVNKSASMHGPLLASGLFAVSLLAREQADLVGLFSSPDQRHLRFAGAGWGQLVTGAPVQTEAIAALDCKIAQVIDAATHSLIIGAVIATRAAAQGAEPLVYFQGGAGGFTPLA